ncbi:MAG: prolyl aminopeptidase, partial [Hyphomicrobiales bacterium]|nr:prolyl aminopeptidase [Hyphomicrobiales bacterium]
IDWLYGDGARHVFPEAHEAFLGHLPEQHRGDPIAAYHRLLTSGDEETELAAASAWCAYEGQMLTLLPRGYVGGSGFVSPHTRALARIEAHYFVNKSFMEEGEILAKASRLAGLPGVIVQGRYDAVTPPVTAYELYRAWPGSTLDIAPDAGHATVEPSVLRRIIAATDRFGQV